MILADENLDQRIINALRAHGYAVDSVAELHRSVDDYQVIELARQVPPRIIVTRDRDFGEWVFAHDVRDISVIYLRYAAPDTALITEALLGLLSKEIVTPKGMFCTVTTQKIRLRHL